MKRFLVVVGFVTILAVLVTATLLFVERFTSHKPMTALRLWVKDVRAMADAGVTAAKAAAPKKAKPTAKK